MKKLLILTTFGILTAVLGGCHLCDRLWRGSAVTAQPAAVYCEPPCAAVPACDPCGSAGPVMVSPRPGGLPWPDAVKVYPRKTSEVFKTSEVCDAAV